MATEEIQPVIAGHNRYGSTLNKDDTKADPDQPVVYEIRVKGQLGREWTGWFENLTITPEDEGDTLLCGPVVDQAALHGLMRKVRDLGLPLVSVLRVEQRGDKK